MEPYTDSIDANSIICTNLELVTIENFFLANYHEHNDFVSIDNSGQTGPENDLDGNNMIRDVEPKVLNWKDFRNSAKNTLKYSKIIRIVRHLSTKDKWHIVSKVTTKSITVTADHNIVIFRFGKKMLVTPPNIKARDQVLCVNRNKKLSKKDWILEEIETCLKIGAYDNEYTYNLETDWDDNSTYMINDILISCR